MKFFLITLMVIFTFSGLAISQEENYLNLSNNKIYQIIKISNEKYNHLQNPSLIYPGQSLVFEIHDGLKIGKKVKTGDTQWSIVSQITENDTIYSSIIEKSIDTLKPRPIYQSSKSSIDIECPWWTIIGTTVIFGGMVWLFFYLKKKGNS